MLIVLFAVVVFFGIAAVLIGNAYENGHAEGYAYGRASREEEITLLEDEAYCSGYDAGYDGGWCNAWRSCSWHVKGF